MNDNRTHIFGVDFSGAQDAGRKIWIAEALSAGDQLDVRTVYPAADLPHGGVRRDDALAALRAFIEASGESVFGLDFPFSLPRQIVAARDWLIFARLFSWKYPQPELFQELCLAAANGRELKRDTDREAQTPFCAYNLRLYRQTYFGIRDLLAPLVSNGLARVLPMQSPEPGVPWLLEICPASTLKQMPELYRPYKDAPDRQTHRTVILDALAASGVRMTIEVRRAALADRGGDALDSIIAAYATWRTLQNPSLLEPRSENERIEGRVYV